MPMLRAPYLWFVGLYAAALLVAQLPGDPSGDFPPFWLAVDALLTVLAWRGSRVAWAVLLGLHLFFLASFFLLVWPIGWQLAAFYGLLALAAVSLAVVPLGSREARGAGPAARREVIAGRRA
ncbi:hypothetical protein [Modestobacter roseus]|uniref:hypothetical protein n=1 Tax=Modestobacter roseus TaxID=1181884 RepID=UPI0034DF5AA3